jgi:hypothetical protein
MNHVIEIDSSVTSVTIVRKAEYDGEPQEQCRRERDRHLDELIAKRNWPRLDSEFGLFEHRGQTVVLYKMLKRLIDLQTADKV